MNCPTCGKENETSARFCGICGSQLSGQQATVSQYGVDSSNSMVGFREAISLGFKNCLNFSGRATRAEYWWWQLFALIVLVIMLIGQAMSDFLGTILSLGFLGILILSLPISIRRLHDCGKSALWLLITLLPFGVIILLVFMCLSPDYDNRYGPDPRIIGR
jgi:uncharacterized membrane protein YhaH (DUF805 family)